MTAECIDIDVRHLTPDELSARLQVPRGTLNNWATKGKGPRYMKVGVHRRYRLQDVLEWEQAQISNPGRPTADR